MGISVEWGGKNVEVGYLAAAKVLGNGISGFFRMIFGKTTLEEREKIKKALTDGKLESKDVKAKDSSKADVSGMQNAKNGIQESLKKQKAEAAQNILEENIKKMASNNFVPINVRNFIENKSKELKQKAETLKQESDKNHKEIVKFKNQPMQEKSDLKELEKKQEELEKKQEKLNKEFESLEEMSGDLNKELEDLQKKAKEILGEGGVGNFEETMEKLQQFSKDNSNSKLASKAYDLLIDMQLLDSNYLNK